MPATMLATINEKWLDSDDNGGGGDGPDRQRTVGFSEAINQYESSPDGSLSSQPVIPRQDLLQGTIVRMANYLYAPVPPPRHNYHNSELWID